MNQSVGWKETACDGIANVEMDVWSNKKGYT
jgi:hypothetical protein